MSDTTETIVNGDNPQTTDTRKRFDASVNYNALKELEGKSVSSFLELVRRVIVLNGEPYESANVKFTASKKIEYTMLIEEKARLKFNGNKCFIQLVLEQDNLNDLKGFRYGRYIDRLKDN